MGYNIIIYKIKEKNGMQEVESLIVEKTEVFKKWLHKLRDTNAKANIVLRLLRLQDGNLGDVKHIKEDVFEMRFFIGAGYRIYYWHPEKGEIILLLCGGDKSTQKRDIEKALNIKKDLEKRGNENA